MIWQTEPLQKGTDFNLSAAATTIASMREGGGRSSDLTLHNHIDILKTAISQGCDVRLILDDGELTASSAVLATFSGWLRQLLLEAVHSNTWLDEVPLLW